MSGAGSSGESTSLLRSIHPHGKLSDVEAVVSLIKAMFGAGVLAAPFCFSKSGVLGDTVSILAVGAFVLVSMHFIMQLKHNVRKNRSADRAKDPSVVGAHEEHILYSLSYPELAREIYGDVAHHVVVGTLLCAQVGAPLAYHIFVARSIDGWIGDNIGLHEAGPLYVFIPVCVAPFILFGVLSVHYSPKLLGIFATVGVVMEIGTLMIIISFGMWLHCGGGDAVTAGILAATTAATTTSSTPSAAVAAVAGSCGANMQMLDVWAIPMTMGMTCFAFMGVFVTMSVEHTMQNRHNYDTFFVIAIGVAVFFNCAFGFCGYFIFGSDVASVITLNFSGQFGMFVKLMLSVVLVLNYPVALFPVIHWTDYIVLQIFGAENQRLRVFQVLAVSGYVVFSTVTATLFPYFGKVLGLIGSIGFGIGIGLVPPILYIKVFPNPPIKDKILLLFVFAFGATVLFLGLQHSSL